MTRSSSARAGALPQAAGGAVSRSNSRLRVVVGLLLAGCLPAWAAGAAETAESTGAARPEQWNVLLITADDMAYESLGVNGCTIPGITPNLDRLAAQGMRFERAHVTIAVCQPSRSVLMTGRYPYRHGARGFEPIRHDVPTLGESLRAAGYLNGIFGKVQHLAPLEKYCWDVVVQPNELGAGRDPALYYQHTRAFLEKARSAGRPFFLMANSQDPHRPFAGSPPREGARPRRREAQEATAQVSTTYTPEVVPVPCFLPDIPEVRQELAWYYASVHRCDQTVGQILRALEESGLAERTIVMFLSDNGMPFPFAKTNCYPFSTRTPWIVRWPGKIKPGSVDRQHFISGIDFLPTILEVLGLPPVPEIDGRSFLPLLRGEPQSGRESVYTTFHKTSGRREYEMRGLQDGAFAYIYNAWSDGQKTFISESTGSASFQAMQRAAESDPTVAARVEFLTHRVPEELYDLKADPCCLRNLAAQPGYQSDLKRLREQMQGIMERTQDPLLAAHRERVAGGS